MRTYAHAVRRAAEIAERTGYAPHPPSVCATCDHYKGPTPYETTRRRDGKQGKPVLWGEDHKMTAAQIKKFRKATQTKCAQGSELALCSVRNKDGDCREWQRS